MICRMPNWLILLLCFAALSLVAPASMYAATKSPKQAADAWKSWLGYIGVVVAIGLVAVAHEWLTTPN